MGETTRKLNRKALWAGRTLSALAAAALFADAMGRLLVESPLLTHILTPIYVAMVVWGGLLLRDARLRTLLTVRSAS